MKLDEFESRLVDESYSEIVLVVCSKFEFCYALNYKTKGVWAIITLEVASSL